MSSEVRDELTLSADAKEDAPLSPIWLQTMNGQTQNKRMKTEIHIQFSERTIHLQCLWQRSNSWFINGKTRKSNTLKAITGHQLIGRINDVRDELNFSASDKGKISGPRWYLSN